jgi:tRNA-2-methylthio-N6-dimethylallyladenosine synthase
MGSPDIIGQVLPVTIESLERYSLLGQLAFPDAEPAFSHMTNSPQLAVSKTTDSTQTTSAQPTMGA